MPQIREQIAMVHLPPSKTLKYLFHVRKTKRKSVLVRGRIFVLYDSFFIIHYSLFIKSDFRNEE